MISYTNIEVIVVDNASPDDNPDIIKEKFPEIVFIKSEVNLGFAGGNNLGVRKARGDYFLFINNDVEVPVAFLEPLVDALEENPQIGMVSPKIKYHWDSTLIQYAGYNPMSHWTIRNSSIGYKEKDEGQYDTLRMTDSIHGAAMMISRKVARKVGLMTEVYFLYYEEHDWAAMVKRAGYQHACQGSSYILHKESISTGKDSPLKTYYINRNRILFARRNFKRQHLLFSLTYLCFVSVPKNTLVFLMGRKFKHLSAYWKALIWNLSNFSVVKSHVEL
jgi:GT2 family glycosyltransferase